MPARKVVSNQQLERLLDAMEADRGFASGRLWNTGPLAKLQVRDKWERLATQLNAVGVGATKSGSKWRDYWAEKKCAVRKKAQARSVHARGTGGGPPSQIKLTDVEERILSLISSVAVEGNVGVRIPYDSDDLPPPPPPVVPSASPSPPPVSPPTASPEEPQAGPSSPQHGEINHTPRQLLSETPLTTAPSRPRLDRSRIEAQPPQWAVDFEERQAALLETLALCARDMVASNRDMVASNRAVVAEVTALRESQAASSREVVAALREHTRATEAATAAQAASTAVIQATGEVIIAALRNILAPR